MSNNLKECLMIFKFINNIKNEKMKLRFLKSLADDERIFAALHEIAFNAINGNIPLKNSHKAKILRNKKLIATIAASNPNKISRLKKKKLIIQSGGFISNFLPLLNSIIKFL